MRIIQWIKNYFWIGNFFYKYRNYCKIIPDFWLNKILKSFKIIVGIIFWRYCCWRQIKWIVLTCRVSMACGLSIDPFYSKLQFSELRVYTGAGYLHNFRVVIVFVDRIAMQAIELILTHQWSPLVTRVTTLALLQVMHRLYNALHYYLAKDYTLNTMHLTCIIWLVLSLAKVSFEVQ